MELYYLYDLYNGEASISRETMERGNSSIKVKFIKILKAYLSGALRVQVTVILRLLIMKLSFGKIFKDTVVTRVLRTTY